MHAKDLTPYFDLLKRWGNIQNLKLQPVAREVDRVCTDAVFCFKTAESRAEYGAELKKNLPYQNIAFVIAQLRNFQKAQRRLIVFAPYIRKTQADALIKAGVDYVDLVGNAHIGGAGLLIHIEGKKPQEPIQKPEGRAFKPAGLRVLYLLLTRKEAVTWPHRMLATEAGVALTAANLAVRDLIHRGFVAGRGRQRTLLKREDLIALWVQGYATQLRRKLGPKRYFFAAHDNDELIRRLKDAFAKCRTAWAITGAEAAWLLTRYYREERVAVYVQHLPPEFHRDNFIMPAREGNLELLGFFCPELKPWREVDRFPLAHPLLIYAELMCQGTNRAVEAANEVLDRHFGNVVDED